MCQTTNQILSNVEQSTFCAFVNRHMATVVNRQDKAWHAHGLQEAQLNGGLVMIHW